MKGTLKIVMNDKIAINSESIRPASDLFETQIILQRHCNYDREKGSLTDASKLNQEKIVLQFLRDLDNRDLNDIYFLFIASNTINSHGEKQRCVDSVDIAMNLIRSFLESKGIGREHIINLDENLNYDGQVKRTDSFSEPKMFTDNTGYLHFLKEKSGGMNSQFWIDFEEDRYRQERKELDGEGPDEIVERGVHFINVIQRFASYFHLKKPNSKLIVWCGTHYDLISPLAKQTIFGYEKSDIIAVDYCGGISLNIDKSHDLIANVNGQSYQVSFEGIKQPHRRL